MLIFVVMFIYSHVHKPMHHICS